MKIKSPKSLIASSILSWGALGALTLTTARAAIVLDQSFEVVSGSQPFSATNKLTQTVTTGVAGKLTQIDVLLTNRNDVQSVILTMYPTIAGIPNTSASLGSKTFALPSTGSYNGTSFRTLDISDLDLSFSVGDIFAFELSGPSSSLFFTWMAGGFFPPPEYIGGARYNTTATPTLAGGDHIFRTYVDAIPETSCLVLSAFGAFAFLARRRMPSSGLFQGIEQRL